MQTQGWIFFLVCSLNSAAVFLASRCSLFMGGIKPHPLAHPLHTSADAWCIHFLPQQQKSTLNLLPREYTWICIVISHQHIYFVRDSAVKMYLNVLVCGEKRSITICVPASWSAVKTHRAVSSHWPIIIHHWGYVTYNSMTVKMPHLPGRIICTVRMHPFSEATWQTVRQA